MGPAASSQHQARARFGPGRTLLLAPHRLANQPNVVAGQSTIARSTRACAKGPHPRGISNGTVAAGQGIQAYEHQEAGKRTVEPSQDPERRSSFLLHSLSLRGHHPTSSTLTKGSVRLSLRLRPAISHHRYLGALIPNATRAQHLLHFSSPSSSPSFNNQEATRPRRLRLLVLHALQLSLYASKTSLDKLASLPRASQSTWVTPTPEYRAHLSGANPTAATTSSTCVCFCYCSITTSRTLLTITTARTPLTITTLRNPQGGYVCDGRHDSRLHELRHCRLDWLDFFAHTLLISMTLRYACYVSLTSCIQKLLAGVRYLAGQRFWNSSPPLWLVWTEKHPPVDSRRRPLSSLFNLSSALWQMRTLNAQHGRRPPSNTVQRSVKCALDLPSKLVRFWRCLCNRTSDSKAV
ncbi:hypothetical protein IWZ01DRAFT_120493 [Phyllosticta capitalensis]